MKEIDDNTVDEYVAFVKKRNPIKVHAPVVKNYGEVVENQTRLISAQSKTAVAELAKMLGKEIVSVSGTHVLFQSGEKTFMVNRDNVTEIAAIMNPLPKSYLKVKSAEQVKQLINLALMNCANKYVSPESVFSEAGRNYTLREAVMKRRIHPYKFFTFEFLVEHKLLNKRLNQYNSMVDHVSFQEASYFNDILHQRFYEARQLKRTKACVKMLNTLLDEKEKEDKQAEVITAITGSTTTNFVNRTDAMPNQYAPKSTEKSVEVTPVVSSEVVVPVEKDDIPSTESAGMTTANAPMLANIMYKVDHNTRKHNEVLAKLDHVINKLAYIMDNMKTKKNKAK
jgi:hypothetical protein